MPRHITKSPNWLRPRQPSPSEINPALLATLSLLILMPSLAVAGVAPGPDAFGYTIGPTTAYSFTNIVLGYPANGAKRTLNFDDDESVTVTNIGFTFNFYGSNYTTVSFTPNGLLTFGGTNSAFNNVDLTVSVPGTNLPCIAVLWDDWETKFNGHPDAVYYFTTGTVGSRQFIVQWNKVVPIQGDGTNDVTFEARLFEGSDKILFSYFDAVVSDESDPDASLGVGATVGIRDTSGQTNDRNLQWSFNQAVITNGLNLLFSLPNHPPIATNDAATTAEDTPVTVSVLANDRDPDGDALTLVAITQGTNGIVTTNVNGTVTYRPATNFFGADLFTYTISDGQGGSATGMVSVTINPVNDPPVAQSTNITTAEDAPVSINLLGTDVDGDSLTYSLVSSPMQGSLSGNAPVLVYTPSNNFNGADNFNFRVTDGQGGSATGTVSITVSPVSDDPEAGSDSADTCRNTALILPGAALLANDSDADVGDVLSVVNVSATSSSGGSVTFASGTVTYTPPTNFFGSDTFTYTMSDGHGGNATGTVTVRVSPPLTIMSIARQPSGSLVIRFCGFSGSNYEMKASTNLMSWTNLGILSESEPGVFQFEDTGTAGLDARFYRVVAP